jgi:SAM-dependent methyltransferase
MSQELHDMRADAEQFWEKRYQAASPRTSGRPGIALRRFAEPVPPGRALESGCGKGDDAVWLAPQGWSVVAVEISRTALEYAAANAGRAGVSDRVRFERHDLSRTFPEGQFDLVTATFSPRRRAKRCSGVRPTPSLRAVTSSSSTTPPDCLGHPRHRTDARRAVLDSPWWRRVRIGRADELGTDRTPGSRGGPGSAMRPSLTGR